MESVPPSSIGSCCMAIDRGILRITVLECIRYSFGDNGENHWDIAIEIDGLPIFPW